MFKESAQARNVCHEQQDKKKKKKKKKIKRKMGT